MEKKKNGLKSFAWILAFVLAVLLIFYITDTSGMGKEISLVGNDPALNFEDLVNNGQVSDVYIIGSTVKVKKKGSTIKNFPNNADYYFTVSSNTDIAKVWDFVTAFNNDVDNDFDISIKSKPQSQSIFEQLLPYLSIVVVVVMAIFLIIGRWRQKRFRKSNSS